MQFIWVALSVRRFEMRVTTEQMSLGKEIDCVTHDARVTVLIAPALEVKRKSCQGCN